MLYFTLDIYFRTASGYLARNQNSCSTSPVENQAVFKFSDSIWLLIQLLSLGILFMLKQLKVMNDISIDSSFHGNLFCFCFLPTVGNMTVNMGAEIPLCCILEFLEYISQRSIVGSDNNPIFH